MSEMSEEALAAACAEKVRQLEFSVKQSAFYSVRKELETELAIARVALAALRERAEPVAGNAAEFSDAYQGAREDLQIWKRRALEAEGEARRLAEINDYLVLQAQGEHRFGEPVVREPGALLHCAEQLHNGGTALYTAPPAPVVAEPVSQPYKLPGKEE